MGFKTWVRSILSVAISSAANGVTLVVVDPSTFNLSKGLPKLAQVCSVLALVHIALFLQKSPIWNDAPNFTQPVEPAQPNKEK